MALSQAVSIQGKITDARTNETLPGANVVIEGTTTGATSDFDGKFSILQLAPGKYNLLVSFVGYQQQVIREVEVKGEKIATLEIKLSPAVNELLTAEITASRVTHTETAVLMEMKESEQIVNGVSSMQIARSQDRSASDVAKRIPGVTIVENRFVMVRGLSERYNSVLLNGIGAPSAEADRKAFSFDLVPSGLLDRVLIYKTGAPELPGEFAGGVIKIYTKNIPDENAVSAGYSTSYRNGTTFKDFYTGEKGKYDFMGFDDGTRSLPGSFPENLNQVNDVKQVVALSKSLPNNWNTTVKPALPDQRLNILITRKFKVNDIRIGNITNLSYSNTRESTSSKNYSYNSFNLEEQKSDSIYKYEDHISTAQAKTGLIHNWSFVLSDHNRIEFRNLLNQSGTNQTTLRSGYNIEEDGNVKSYSFYYQQRTIYSGQLSGNHEMRNNRTKLDWIGGYSLSRTKEPDFRRIRTKTAGMQSSGQYYVVIAPSASELDAGRFYSDLAEDMHTVALNFEHAFKRKSGDEENLPKVRAGAYYENKERSFEARWLSYKRSMSSQFNNSLLELPVHEIFSEENINSSTGFKLEEGTNPSDAYTASNRMMAFYAGGFFPLTMKIKLSGGVRLENNHQQLGSKKYSGEVVEVDLNLLSILPSVNVSYDFSDRSLIRAAYSRTVNRPEFRELAPFSYYDFTYNYVIYGNADLKTASIDNYDLRWEFYPTTGELISAGVFYKNFSLPIERFFVPGTGSGGTRNFTFGNADKSVSSGLEVEVKKSLERMSANSILKKLSIYMNASVIHSRVQLGEQAKGQLPSRPMMGQSPYIVNAGLYYHNRETGLQVNVLYNIIGRRLYAVGTVGTPDIYEMPRNLLDLTIVKSFGKHLEARIGIQDILSQELLLKQDADESGTINLKDEVITSRNPGTYFTAGLNVKF